MECLAIRINAKVHRANNICRLKMRKHTSFFHKHKAKKKITFPFVSAHGNDLYIARYKLQINLTISCSFFDLHWNSRVHVLSEWMAQYSSIISYCFIAIGDSARTERESVFGWTMCLNRIINTANQWIIGYDSLQCNGNIGTVIQPFY